MKRVVSVSLGSTSRDYATTEDLLGQRILIERIGTDGDVDRAKALYEELDGHVDCLGVGGAVLTFDALDRQYALPSVERMVSGVEHTPVVDGSGFKNVVEYLVAGHIVGHLGNLLPERRVLITSAVDRLALTKSFAEAGFELIIGDLAFALGIPVAVHSLRGLNRLAHTIGPIVRHLPMSMLYPTGQNEDENVPRYKKWFEWARVIGGDCNYITHHMPLDMRGKIIATNTTTARDVSLFRERGVVALVTSTPRLGTRTFGTNVMEAVLVALSGTGRPLERSEVEALVAELGWGPQIERLNDMSATP